MSNREQIVGKYDELEKEHFAKLGAEEFPDVQVAKELNKIGETIEQRERAGRINLLEFCQSVVEISENPEATVHWNDTVEFQLYGDETLADKMTDLAKKFGLEINFLSYLLEDESTMVTFRIRSDRGLINEAKEQIRWIKDNH